MKGRKRKLKVSLAGAPKKAPQTTFDLRGEYVHGIPPDVGPIEVENPHDSSQKIIVFRKLRDDPLGRMQDRGQIDEAQYRAGRRWQSAYELAEMGARAIDTTREAVDGGQIAQASISDAQADAFAVLAKGARALGMIAESVVRDVLANRMSIAAVAIVRGKDDERERDHYGKMFRESLSVLAFVYGFALDPPARK